MTRVLQSVEGTEESDTPARVVKVDGVRPFSQRDK